MSDAAAFPRVGDAGDVKLRLGIRDALCSFLARKHEDPGVHIACVCMEYAAGAATGLTEAAFVALARDAYAISERTRASLERGHHG